MSQVKNVRYKLRLYQLRADLLELGIGQPVKEMIDRGLWKENPYNHTYLSGRAISAAFVDALERLKTICEDV